MAHWFATTLLIPSIMFDSSTHSLAVTTPQAVSCRPTWCMVWMRIALLLPEASHRLLFYAKFHVYHDQGHDKRHYYWWAPGMTPVVVIGHLLLLFHNLFRHDKICARCYAFKSAILIYISNLSSIIIPVLPTIVDPLFSSKNIRSKSLFYWSAAFVLLLINSAFSSLYDASCQLTVCWFYLAWSGFPFINYPFRKSTLAREAVSLSFIREQQ